MYTEVRQTAAGITRRSRLREKFERVLSLCPPSTWLDYAACVEFSNARYVLLEVMSFLFVLSHHWLPTLMHAVGAVSAKGHVKRSTRNLRHVCHEHKHVHTEVR